MKSSYVFLSFFLIFFFAFLSPLAAQTPVQVLPWTLSLFDNTSVDGQNKDFFCTFGADNPDFLPPGTTNSTPFLCVTITWPVTLVIQADDFDVFGNPIAHTLQVVNYNWTEALTDWGNIALPPSLNGNLTLVNTSLPNATTDANFTFPENGVLFLIDKDYPTVMIARINVTCSDKGPHCPITEGESSSSSYGGWEYNYSIFISWLTLILLWISIGGALLTILTFTIHHEIRTYPIKLIMYLCVCIVVGNFFFLMAFERGFVINTSLCFLTAATIHGFFLSNFCWTFCIAFNFYQMIVKRNRESESLEKWYHAFCWGFPIFCVQWTAGFLKYGNAGGFCYITNNIFIFVFFFVPGLLIISSNAILFFFVAREIHETLASAPKTDKRERRKEFRVYISIFISIGLSWIFGFIEVLFTVTVIRFIFLTLFTIFTCLQGFLIFVFYCINLKVLGKWAGLFGKCIPFFKRFENIESRRTTSSGRTGTSRSTSRMNSSNSGNSMNSMDENEGSSAGD